MQISEEIRNPAWWWLAAMLGGVIYVFVTLGWLWGLGSIAVAVIASLVMAWGVEEFEVRRLAKDSATVAYFEYKARSASTVATATPRSAAVAPAQTWSASEFAPDDALGLILQCIDPTNIRAVDLAPGIAQLQREGPRGTDRLAPLLRDLYLSRSPGIVYALNVATHLERTAALIDVLSRIAASGPTTPSSAGTFPPEISGDGRIGWTDATHARVIELSRRALG